MSGNWVLLKATPWPAELMMVYKGVILHASSLPRLWDSFAAVAVMSSCLSVLGNWASATWSPYQLVSSTVWRRYANCERPSEFFCQQANGSVKTQPNDIIANSMSTNNNYYLHEDGALWFKVILLQYISERGRNHAASTGFASRSGIIYLLVSVVTVGSCRKRYVPTSCHSVLAITIVVDEVLWRLLVNVAVPYPKYSVW